MRLSPADIERTRAEWDRHKGNTTHMARALNMSRHAMQNRVKQMRAGGVQLQEYPTPKGGWGAREEKAAAAGDEVRQDYGQEACSLFSLSSRITTLEQLLAAADVDLEEWEVDRWTCNKWEIGAKHPSTGEILVEPLFQVKASLKRKVVAPLFVALGSLTQEIANASPRHPAYKPRKIEDPHMLEISPFDHHFGKLAWDKETGQDYDVEIAERLFSDAFHDLLAKAAGFQIEKVLIPIGNDFLHVNNADFTTAKGTRQDVDSRLPKIFKTAARAVINAVDMCIPAAPVELVWVPGNHDPLTSYFLMAYLEAFYRNCGSVTVDVSPKTRKYVHYGVNLLGFTHGSEEPHRDLPTIMAGECREHWADVWQCEWHVGHVHKRKETRFNAGDTYGAVGVRVLPSLCATDAWHYRKGYVKSQRAAEAYLWSKARGYVGHFSSNVEGK